MRDLSSQEVCLPGTAWFAVQTAHKCEFRVVRDLAAKGFSAYLPLLREKRQWTDRTKVIEIPAFTGYLFLRHDSSVRNRSRVLDTVGVTRMLPDNHRPCPIADEEIESLRRALDSNVPCARCEPLPVGTKVRVMRGALAGLDGQIARINNKARLVIQIASISQAISVEVDMNDVEPIAEFAPRPSQPQSPIWRPSAPALATV